MLFFLMDSNRITLSKKDYKKLFVNELRLSLLIPSSLILN
jgi:hypothetical protein